MNSYLDLKEFYFDLPLYTTIKIESDNLSKWIKLLEPGEKFDAYNPIIKENSTYTTTRIHQKAGPLWNCYTGIKEFEIKCLRNNFAVRIFLLVEHKNEDDDFIYISKIGQTPSIAYLHIARVKEYHNVLDKFKIKEFTKAIGLAANGVGIGSFVYLRRIFEYLIEDAHEQAKKEINWSESRYFESRIVERIGILKDYLPPFLVANKTMYGILSKGIHELEEDECLKYFDALKVGIELILDEKVEDLKKEFRLKDAQNKIQIITSQIKTEKS